MKTQVNRIILFLSGVIVSIGLPWYGNEFSPVCVFIGLLIAAITFTFKDEE
jgi:hypothetical protein